MGTQTFTTTGTWSCPAGVKTVQAEAWGGGANGYGGSSAGTPGGGAGAYAKTNSITVIPGKTYDVTVDIGQSSSFAGESSQSVLAYKGSGSAGGAVANCIGDVKVAGGNGGPGTTGPWGGAGGGGCGGTNGAVGLQFEGGAAGTGSYGGGNGGIGGNQGGNGEAGTAPGGAGGSGGSYFLENVWYYGNAGAGTAGQVKLAWTDATNIVLNSPGSTL